MPLAVLGKPPAGTSRGEALPGRVERIVERAKAEAGVRAKEVVTSAFILAGVHSHPDLVSRVFQRCAMMIESSTYPLLEEMAYTRVAREFLINIGTAKLGAPTAEQVEKLEMVRDRARLTRMGVKLPTVDSWDKLLRVR